jgi:nucleotide-binding universal stress UspA family protein/CheY-like chemotaxis protein
MKGQCVIVGALHYLLGVRGPMRNRSEKMMKKILVPVDGSGYASKAIDFAADLAKIEEVEIHLIHVVRHIRIPEQIREYVRTERIEEPPEVFFREKIGKKLLSWAEEEARKRGLSRIEISVSGGDPAEEIINYASYYDVDLIVMGSQGLSGGKSRIGSVAIQVLLRTDRTCVIVKKGLLEGKKVLIVDDEPDVLETLEEFLPMCEVARASSFDEAKELLEARPFDLAVLDIMGVDGYELLDIAKEKKVLPVMLTAHAMTVEDTAKSYRKGAASYLPKEKMSDIAIYLNDVLEAQERGQSSWWRWLQRFGSFYEKKFGSGWKDAHKDFLN